jgi:hypothetical protein
VRVRKAAIAVGTVLAIALAAAPPASGQLLYSGHIAHATDALGGTTGLGGRVGVGLPLLPAELLAGVEYYFTGCSTACGFQGLSVDANAWLPFSLLTPYATGGWVVRRYDAPGPTDAESDSGIHLGAGISGGLAGMRLFGEGRYEFLDVPEGQFVFRAGFVIGG